MKLLVTMLQLQWQSGKCQVASGKVKATQNPKMSEQFERLKVVYPVIII